MPAGVLTREFGWCQGKTKEGWIVKRSFCRRTDSSGRNKNESFWSPDKNKGRVVGQLSLVECCSPTCRRAVSASHMPLIHALKPSSGHFFLFSIRPGIDSFGNNHPLPQIFVSLYSYSRPKSTVWGPEWFVAWYGNFAQFPWTASQISLWQKF